MKIENTEALKEYLCRKVDPICDADPAVLADYIIALLIHDKPTVDLKEMCISHLEDFLREETTSFVDQLFRALELKEYLSPSAAEGTSGAGNEFAPQSSGLLEVQNRRRDRDSDDEEDDGDRNFKHRRGKASEDSPGDQRRVNDTPQFDNPRKRRGGKYSQPDGFQEEESAKSHHVGSVVDGSIGTFPMNAPTGGQTGVAAYQGTSRMVGGQGMGRGYDPNVPVDGNQFNRNERNNGPTQMNEMSGGVPQLDQRYNRGGFNNNYGRGRGTWRGDRQGAGRGFGMQQGRGGGQMDNRVGPPGGMGRRPRCRDYDEKGYCLRGDMCMYDHGLDRIVVDDVPGMAGVGQFDLSTGRGMMPQTRPFPIGAMTTAPNTFGQPATPPQEAYDPERATFGPQRMMNPMNGGPSNPAGGMVIGGGFQNMRDPMQISIENQGGFQLGGFGDGMQGGFRGGRGGFRGRGRGGTGGFRPQNPQYRNNTTLVVENIPPEFCRIDRVNDFFKKFGVIVNISVQPHESRAIVQFTTNNEARAALSSPDPIFENRFVKVYWQKADNNQDATTNPDVGAIGIVPLRPAGQGGVTEPEQPHSALVGNVAPTGAQSDKRAEQERLRKRLELQKQRQSLIEKYLQQQRELTDKLKSKQNMTPEQVKSLTSLLTAVQKKLQQLFDEQKADAAKAVPVPVPVMAGAIIPSQKVFEEKERERLDRELDFLHKINDTSAAPDATNEEIERALKAQLDALKSEALSLGIDPAAVLSASTPTAGRGRGRGSWLGGRGGYSYGSQPRSFRLDNRTTKILVKDANIINLERLKSNFEKVGEVDAVSETETNTYIVTMKTRKDAEKGVSAGYPQLHSCLGTQIRMLEASQRLYHLCKPALLFPNLLPSPPLVRCKQHSMSGDTRKTMMKSGRRAGNTGRKCFQARYSVHVI
ncbi:hypothetical protein BJ742DRAFT_26479 [Cladochytrium replicatum]|nr:hypothetical protein BJ742DRAFT_26479 [Cladochytrium replicatum]